MVPQDRGCTFHSFMTAAPDMGQEPEGHLLNDFSKGTKLLRPITYMPPKEHILKAVVNRLLSPEPIFIVYLEKIQKVSHFESVS